MTEPPRHRLRRAAAAVGRVVVAGMRGLCWMGWNPGLLSLGQGTPRLVECVHCGGDHVCPVDAEVVDEARWWIRLRCGDCGVWREVVATNDEAAAFERAIGQHAAAIDRAAARLDLERMARELDSFVVALERDLIDPSSFTRV